MSDENDAQTGSPKVPAVQSPASWRHLIVAAILGLLSLITKWQVTDTITLSGGATLVGLAALVLLWPVVRQVAARGGEIDLKGLRVKVNEIQNEAQRIENDNTMRIEELESELNELRAGTQTQAVNADAGTVPERTDIDNSVLERAAIAYANSSDMTDFRRRVEIDKSIIRKGRHLSLATLRTFLDSNQWTMEAQMAAAVALGLPPPKDEEVERARLLCQLIHSNHERTRARAGQSAKRWAERSTTSSESRNTLLSAIDDRLLDESTTSGARTYLKKAQEVLRATRELSKNQ